MKRTGSQQASQRVGGALGRMPDPGACLPGRGLQAPARGVLGARAHPASRLGAKGDAGGLPAVGHGRLDAAAGGAHGRGNAGERGAPLGKRLHRLFLYTKCTSDHFLSSVLFTDCPIPSLLIHQVYQYHGPARNRSAAFLSQQDIVITTYATLAQDLNSSSSGSMAVSWLRVVLDEAHTIKNAKSQQSRAAAAVKAERRYFGGYSSHHTELHRKMKASLCLGVVRCESFLCNTGS